MPGLGSFILNSLLQSWLIFKLLTYSSIIGRCANRDAFICTVQEGKLKWYSDYEMVVENIAKSSVLGKTRELEKPVINTMVIND